MWTAGILLVLGLTACGGSKAASDGATQEPMPKDGPAPIVEDIHFYGRWDATHTAGWPGAQIVTRFSGTSLSATVREQGDDYLEITIDGQRQAPIHLANGVQTVPIATGLAPGEHDVVIAKRTESFVGTLRFDGFAGATLIPTPRRTRVIELIGDSITAGYGITGAGPSCGFTAATESEPRAWGALAAEDLGAAHISVAYSGIGMYRNCCGAGGSTTDTMPTRYGRHLADQASSAWDFHVVPDVVVIALGTNDFSGGDPGPLFVEAYKKFITENVRAHAPDATIFLAASPMLDGADHLRHKDYLDAVAEHFNDMKIRVVDIPAQLATDGFGCDYHPNEATARKSANALVPAIRSAMGW
ncbi:MAG: hypothetical protein JNL83_07340 [Myxococcales bacterium]|nr:hypothetical protein [Myxococcales bacterium]